jgi:hypothetical protein
MGDSIFEAVELVVNGLKNQMFSAFCLISCQRPLTPISGLSSKIDGKWEITPEIAYGSTTLSTISNIPAAHTAGVYISSSISESCDFPNLIQ